MSTGKITITEPGVLCAKIGVQTVVFTGNPGTAKTSVARLLARILRDNEILSVGKLIEVGRANLVGKYVGHTAIIVKEYFEKARGSVLFIDEAYSLVDDRKGSYGDEAINAIVQEMENNRNDVLVIFAGYKKEMENFLSTNPGLNSRIASHVPFDDYSTSELVDITKLLAKKNSYSIDDGAKHKLASIYDVAKSDECFGNGRYARNIFEKAKMKQANRLLKKDIKFVSDEELTTLTAEDFDVENTAVEQPRFGFFC